MGCQVEPRMLLHALHHYTLWANIILADFNLAVSTQAAKLPNLILRQIFQLYGRTLDTNIQFFVFKFQTICLVWSFTPKIQCLLKVDGNIWQLIKETFHALSKCSPGLAGYLHEMFSCLFGRMGWWTNVSAWVLSTHGLAGYSHENVWFSSWKNGLVD